MYPFDVHYSPNQFYNTTIISYFDKISKISYDNNSRTISWSMPFNYNLAMLESAHVFIHEEARIPVAVSGLYNDSDAYPIKFNATVNGLTISGRNLAIDPYSFKNVIVLHYLLTKDDIIAMAKMHNGSNSEDEIMTFTFSQTMVVPEFGSSIAGLLTGVAIAGVLGAVTLAKKRAYCRRV
jgi:hypothetical protein